MTAIKKGQIAMIAWPKDGGEPRVRVFDTGAAAQEMARKAIRSGSCESVALLNPFAILTPPEPDHA